MGRLFNLNGKSITRLDSFWEQITIQYETLYTQAKSSLNGSLLRYLQIFAIRLLNWNEEMWTFPLIDTKVDRAKFEAENPSATQANNVSLACRYLYNSEQQRNDMSSQEKRKTLQFLPSICDLLKSQLNEKGDNNKDPALSTSSSRKISKKRNLETNKKSSKKKEAKSASP